MRSRARDAVLIGDVRAVVEELGLVDSALVGHSLGATGVAGYAAAHGGRGVDCVDSSLRFGDFAAVVHRIRGALRGEHTMQAVWEMDRQLQLEPYEGMDAMQQRVLAFSRDIVLGVWETLMATPPETLTALAESFLPRIDAPLLSLHGSPSTSDYPAWLTGLVPTAWVEVRHGTGHMLHLVEPERFAARIRQLLAETRS